MHLLLLARLTQESHNYIVESLVHKVDDNLGLLEAQLAGLGTRKQNRVGNATRSKGHRY